MNFYFAPMEGLSRFPYRNAHNKYFNNIDKYFAPFISTNESGSFKKRDLEDITPENNQGLVLIPQILTNNSKDFILMANNIRNMGYNEINLNLGCPSGTVVAKNKGSGFLAKPAELDKFLYEIFEWGGTRISIKTRIGKEHPDEFYELIEIFNKYPVEELTVHPRIQTDFYKNRPNKDMFKHALSCSKNPLCYNGDLFTITKCREFSNEFPEVNSIMLGRGLLINPGLTKEMRSNIKVDKNTLKEFHDEVCNGYKRIIPGDINVLYKMKEIWFYMITMFSENGKYAKKIKKATRLYDYEDAVSSLFREQNLLDDYQKNNQSPVL